MGNYAAAQFSTVRFLSTMSLILTDFDLMASTVEDVILSRSNLEGLEFSCSELDDRWKICSKSIEHISIEHEGYDYDRAISRTVLVDSPNVSSFSFNAGSFDKFAVKNGSSPYASSESCGLR